MVKVLFTVVALGAASAAVGQYPSQPSPPPQQQPPPQPTVQQPQSSSTAGSQGQSSTAQPSSPGASSQQVVVNPPPSQQPSVQPPPPSSTTVVNPPPTYGSGYGQDEVIVSRREEHNPMATVATDAGYGAIAGLLVGTGVALVNQWDHWERDMMVGTGAGVLVGAAVGVVQAGADARDDRRRRVARDGMNRTDKDPVITSRPTFALAFNF